MTDRAAAELDRQQRHVFQGRISGASGIASWCSCGLSFWGVTVADADNSRAVHQADALGKTLGSWIVSAS